MKYVGFMFKVFDNEYMALILGIFVPLVKFLISFKEITRLTDVRLVSAGYKHWSLWSVFCA